MKRTLIVAVLALAGCQHPRNIELLAECFAAAAYETIRAEKNPAKPETKKCCGKCKGGLVKSGDGLAWVSCPCDDSCPCKSAKCTTGACRK